MKYTFIVNPNSRSGMGGFVWNEIEPELKKRQVEYECFRTERAGHAAQLVDALTSDGLEHTIIVLGGDGTVNETVNGIRELDKVTLGYIPSGSSNDFARSLKLPSDPMEALEVVLSSGKVHKMDVGCMERAGKRRRFVVSTGIGFDAAVCHQAAVSKLKILLNKLKLGKLTYVGIAINRLFHDKLVQAQVILDNGETKVFQKVYFVAVMNQLYEGGGFMFCPKAENQDRELDVIVVSEIPKLALLFLLTTAYKGWHVHLPGIHIFRCKEVVIEMDKPLAIHTDGEPAFLRNRMSVKLEEQQIGIIRN